MRTLSASEKRTVRFAVIGVSAYLIIFLGWQMSASVRKRTSAYEDLVRQSQELQQKLVPYGDRALVAEKMMNHYQFDPAKLNRATVVGLASQEIQTTAAGSGIQVGPIRESPAKNAAKEMATLQFEGSGPIPGILGLIKRLETLGYPLVIDSVQVTADPMQPGALKLTMTLVVLDFDQWKTEGKPHA